MTLRDGTQIGCRIIRATRNLSKLIFYTDKGVKEIFKPDMNEVEKANAEQLKTLDEKELIKLGYVSKISVSNIRSLN